MAGRGLQILEERSSTHSSKLESTVHNTQASWTAARCLRLLRPLSSKIALLRKEKQHNTDAEESQQLHSVAATTGCYDVTHNTQGRRRISGKSNAADEEWAPNPRPRKRIKRTYSIKSSISRPRSEVPQSSAAAHPSQTRVEITIPTELFQRKQQLQAEGGVAQLGVDQEVAKDRSNFDPSIFGHYTEHLWPGRPQRKYKVKLPFQWKLTDGIYKGVEALLKATKEQSVRQCGARNLFSTCLRRVPDYIAQEELWYRMEDPESDIDVAPIIYSDLESWSTSETAGWYPLRQVVRAHGMSMVRDAVREGLISINITCGIINMYIRLKAYDEAEGLLESLVRLIESSPKHPTSSEKIRSILKIVDDFILATGRHGVRYRTLAQLLGSGDLPLDWIARHDMIETWNKLVRSVTEQDEHAGSATQLLRLVVTVHYGLVGNNPASFVHAIRLRMSRFLRRANDHLLGLGYQTNWPKGSSIAVANNEPKLHEEKISMTITSLITVLCAIGLLRSSTELTDSSALPVPHLTALQDIAIDAQQMMELNANRVFAMQDNSVAVPLLAAGIVHATTCRSPQAFAEAMPAYFDRLMTVKQNGGAVEEGGSFLCAVAECCARGMSEDVFEHTQKVVQHVRHIAESLRAVSYSHEFCSGVGVAAALEYADTTKHPKHLHWALDLEQAVTGAHLESARRTPAKTPLREQARTRKGYRWEGGICEWVAKTPAAALPRLQVQGKQRMSSQGVDSDGNTISGESSALSLESSSCSSSEQDNADIPMSVLRLRSILGNRRLGEESRGDKRYKGCVRNMFFSHVYIEDESDELSTPDCSRGTQASKGNPIRHNSRVATGMNQAGAAKGQWLETCKRRGCQNRNMDLDSEDELSFL